MEESQEKIFNLLYKANILRISNKECRNSTVPFLFLPVKLLQVIIRGLIAGRLSSSNDLKHDFALVSTAFDWFSSFTQFKIYHSRYQIKDGSLFTHKLIFYSIHLLMAINLVDSVNNIIHIVT